MLLYQTIFNVDSQSKTLDDLKNICCDWIHQRKNSKIKIHDLQFSAYDDFNLLSNNQSEKIITNYVAYDNTESFYFEYQKDLQKADHWITIISVEKTGTNFKIGIKLKTISTNPKPNNKTIKKPLIISRLIDDLGAAFDGEFLIDQINWLDHSSYWIETVAKFMLGEFNGHLPCVYLSQPLSFNEEQIVDLQKELFGLAHIFIEPKENYEFFSNQLRQASLSKNAYQSSIGIYWKQGISRKLFLKPNQNNEELIEELKKLVRSSLLMQKFPKNLTRHFILEKKFRAQIDFLKQKELKDPKDYEELIKLYEEEIDAKNRKITELENASVQYDYQEFRIANNPDEDKTFIQIPFNTAEYFKNEIEYKVYNLILDLNLEQLGLNERNKEIIENLRENIKNHEAYKGYLEHLEQLKTCLSDFKGVTPRLRKILINFNIELSEEGKHVKANFKLDTRYPQTFAKTPSDGRAGKNIYRDFKKIIT